MMKYTQPELPYANNALEPAISEQTVEFHYGKHEKAYIDNLNRLIAGTPYEDAELEDIIREADGALLNNASQAWNHIFYFFTFTPDGGGDVPEGRFKEAIVRDFGSVEAFKSAFEEAATGLFGSGWVWLSRDAEGKLFVTQESNAGNPLRSGLTPILTFDVWEHAYYLDYRNRRAEAVGKLWDIIDWDIIEERYDID